MVDYQWLSSPYSSQTTAVSSYLLPPNVQLRDWERTQERERSQCIEIPGWLREFRAIYLSNSARMFALRLSSFCWFFHFTFPHASSDHRRPPSHTVDLSWFIVYFMSLIFISVTWLSERHSGDTDKERGTQYSNRWVDHKQVSSRIGERFRSCRGTAKFFLARNPGFKTRSNQLGFHLNLSALPGSSIRWKCSMSHDLAIVCTQSRLEDAHRSYQL